jgi:hypothetical protein
VQQDLKVMKSYHYKKQATSRNEWKWIIEQAKIHKELYHQQKEIRCQHGNSVV